MMTLSTFIALWAFHSTLICLSCLYDERRICALEAKVAKLSGGE